MAVTDFFLAGSGSGGTTTIQPATGTVYSFKRGIIGGNTFTLSSAGTNFMGVGRNESSPSTFITTTQFVYFSFSEAGLSFRVPGGGVSDGLAAHPFTAISNNVTTGIALGGRAPPPVANYALVGVSMT